MAVLPKIKICGVTRLSDAQAVIALGGDAIGLNFAPESPRCIRDLSSALAMRKLPEASRILWAGVFVNPSLNRVLELRAALELNIIQLHGEETPAFISQVRREVGDKVQIWKAVRVASREDLKTLSAYACEACVLDAKVAGVRGGSGKTFDWSILENFERPGGLVLSGGLNPDNVGEAVRRVRPDWVDTASGVESAPGIKDETRLNQFIAAVKSQH